MKAQDVATDISWRTPPFLQPCMTEAFGYKEGDYIKALQEEYNKTKDSILDIFTGSHTTRDTVRMEQPSTDVEKTPQNAKKEAFSSCDGVILDVDGDKMCLDKFFSCCRTLDPLVEMFKLDIDNSEDEFMTEFSSWVDEHNKINEISMYGDEWCWSHEPTRDLEIELIEDNGAMSKFKLMGCKIMDILDDGGFIIYIGVIMSL